MLLSDWEDKNMPQIVVTSLLNVHRFPRAIQFPEIRDANAVKLEYREMEIVILFSGRPLSLRGH